MTIVDVSDKFKEALLDAEKFMLRQDVCSGPSRAEKLGNQIADLIDLLERHPKIGHPADFHKVTTPANTAWLGAIQQLVAKLRVEEYLEFTLSPYVVLYAASDERVILLSIRHHRQLGYDGST